MIYENGSRDKLLTEQGYFSIADKKFHYYIQDHQGNNRVVASQDGMIEEVNHYYPFGGIFASNSSVQPFKYNGKELDTKNGLNLYDYGARYYDAALGRWLAADPMAEKYYGISPYNYCNSNPVKYIDPTGMFFTGYTINKSGYISKVNDEGGQNFDVLYNKEKYSSSTTKDYDTSGDKTGIKISKGILSGTEKSNMSSMSVGGAEQDLEDNLTGNMLANHTYKVNSDSESLNIMNFLDKNTNVEWANTLMGDGKGNTINLISTSHQKETVSMGSYPINKFIHSNPNFQVIRADHIHPTAGHNIPSGLKASLNGKHGGDIGNAKNILKSSPKATFRILNNGKYYDYTDEARK